MQLNQWEVLILKPTPAFLTFLAAQLPNTTLPELPLLQTDNTAYLIKKKNNDEETLNEIERHFAKMFRHELSRWLGNNAHKKIDGSFLDFLCCFKFELHSHIVLMESSIKDGKQLLRVKPRPTLLKWMRAAVEENSDLSTIVERVNLAHLAENATVVIKNFSKLNRIKLFLEQVYQTIFAAEMLRLCDNVTQWPGIDSYQTFSSYFTIDIHTQLIHT